MLAGLLGARLGRHVYATTWEKISDSPAPSPTDPDAPIASVALGAALEAASIAAGVAISKAITARAFRSLFGATPEKPKDAKPDPPQGS